MCTSFTPRGAFSATGPEIKVTSAPPATGMLACKDVGKGKLPDPEVLLDYIAMELAREKTLADVHAHWR